MLSFYYMRAIIFIVGDVSFADAKYRIAVLVVSFNLGFCTSSISFLSAFKALYFFVR